MKRCKTCGEKTKPVKVKLPIRGDFCSGNHAVQHLERSMMAEADGGRTGFRV